MVAKLVFLLLLVAGFGSAAVGGAIGDVAFSPNGRTLGFPSDDNAIRLRDVRTHRQPEHAGVIGERAGASTGNFERSRTLLVSAGRRPSPRIVFVGFPRGTTDYWLDSIRLDGKGLRRVALDGSDPAVSPDRTRIAFSDGIGISIVRVNGTSRRHLVGGLGDEPGAPAWAPDGKKLAFIRSGGSVTNGVWTMKPDASSKRFLSKAPYGQGLSWLDARHIVIAVQKGSTEQFAIIGSRNGRVQRWIVPPASAPPAAVAPVVSPNRRELAYTECDGSGCSSTSVDLITLGGRLIRRIRVASAPAWTPAGKLLYVYRARVMLAPAGGGAARAITPPSLQADQPVWLGQGKL